MADIAGDNNEERKINIESYPMINRNFLYPKYIRF